MTDYGTVKESVQEPNHATICWVSSFKQQSHMNWTSQTHDDFRDSASQKLKTTCSSTLTQRIFDFNWTIFHRSIWCWVLERAHSTISCLTSSTKVSFLQCAVVWTSYVQVALRSHEVMTSLQSCRGRVGHTNYFTGCKVSEQGEYCSRGENQWPDVNDKLWSSKQTIILVLFITTKWLPLWN